MRSAPATVKGLPNRLARELQQLAPFLPPPTLVELESRGTWSIYEEPPTAKDELFAS
jgi:hypothetical protein